jgi:hypothetical protein
MADLAVAGQCLGGCIFLVDAVSWEMVTATAADRFEGRKSQENWIVPMNSNLENSANGGGARADVACDSNDDLAGSPASRSGSAEQAPTPRSLASAAASFATSMARFAASGFKTVDKTLHQLRMSHCEPCEYRHDSQCSLCRCFIAKKAWLPHEDCPLGRWPT